MAKEKPKIANQEIGVPGEKVANREIGVPGGKRANREIGVPRGWSQRGYLPHFDGGEVIQHVTFHLADSLPAEVLQRLAGEVEFLPDGKREREQRIRIEAWMDAGHGSCVLREPAVASMVEEALRFFDSARYVLLEWVVMPNHVHVLFQAMEGWDVAKIVASWKKFTAARINDWRREQPGHANLPIGSAPPPVWHREYWDRYIRNDAHLAEAAGYIRENPVAAGLVTRAEDWPWGSARFHPAE